MNLADVITGHAAARPDAPAVLEPGRILSYREFDAAIWRAAAWLRSNGVAAGQVVGNSLPGNVQHLVAVFALARLGAVQLSLPLRESAAYRAALAKRFGVRTVLRADAQADLPGSSVLVPDAGWHEGTGAPDAGLRNAGGDAAWKIVLTSGTTGAPKAVLQTHAMHLAWRGISQAVIPARPDDRYLAIVGIDFHAGFLRCANLFHAGGAVLVGYPTPRTRDVLDLLERESISYANLLPVHLHQLLAVPGDHRGRLRRLRVLRASAGVVSERLCRAILERLTPGLFLPYGSNDGGTPLTVASGDTLRRFPGSIGFASPGVEVQVVDEQDRPVAAGEVGAIRARAPGMPVHYIDDPEASGRAYRGGWYYPGDLGALSPEGALYFKGRSDERMNYDGIKIYPTEIEAALLEHPAVAEAAAFPLASERHQDIPAAAVVLRQPVALEALRDWAAKRLGVRKPRHLLLVDALPRNARGKVLKGELAALAAQQARVNPA